MSKILCLIDSLGAGGAERQLSYLAILLRQQGDEVELVAFTSKHKFYENFLRENGVTPIYNEPGTNKYRRIWEIARIVKKFKPDLVVAYKDGVCISAILAKIFGNFNLAVSERSTTPVLSKKEKLKYWLYRFAEHIVPNSFAQANIIKNQYPKLSSKVKVIGNTVDTSEFIPTKQKKANLVPIILTAARVNRLKNIINYLRAIAIVKEKGIKCHFDWYGKTDAGDPYPDIVKAELEKLNISDYITFHPAHQNVKLLYQTADLFCLPSIIEGFPNVICEAMSSELPIICSNICDNPYIVQDKINGYLFDPQSPDDIAEKIILALGLNSDERIEMGNNNRNRIIELCSPESFINNYLNLI